MTASTQLVGPSPGTTAGGGAPGLGSDLILALGGLIGLAICVYFIFFGEFTPRTRGVGLQEEVATTTSLLGEVRRRPHATLAWNGLRFGAVIHQQDTVYVPDNGELLLAFQDGSELHIEENSLVVIVFRPEPEPVPEPLDDDPTAVAVADELRLLLAEADLGLTVEVVRGGVSGRSTSDEGKITIRSKHSRTRLRSKGEARVRVRKDASTQVHVVSGEVTVASGDEERRLGAQTLQRVGPEGALGAAASLTIPLLAPESGERIWVQDRATRIGFEWETSEGTGPYFLQLARDSEFAETVARTRSAGTTAELPAPAPGVYFWRVGRRGLEGPLRSEERRLVVIEDLPPSLLEPRHGEIVYVPGGGAIAFNWGEVPFAPGYRLRVSKERRLQDPIVDTRTELPSHWQSTAELTEGVYYWSVRIEDPERGRTPWAKVKAFRLITRPLPEPPRLFDAKLLLEGAEVVDESGEQTFLRPLRWLLGPAVAKAATGKTKHRLRWSAVPGIETYEVEIAADEAFTKVIHRSKVKTRFLEWKPPSLEEDYWYRVRSIDPDGRPGKFAKPKLIPAPNRGPAPLGPPDGVRASFSPGATVRLAWVEVPGTARYEVQVSRVATFAKLEAKLGARGETQTRWELAGPGLFFWRVRAIDSAGRSSIWGRTGKIDARLPAPSVQAPRSGASFALRGESAVVNFSWKAGPARKHELQVARDRNFGSVLKTLSSDTPKASYRARKTGRYHFRVRSQDPAGRWSGWSKVSTFRIVEVSLVLTAPEDEAKIEWRAASEPLVFVWRAVRGARAYLLRVSPVEGTGGEARTRRSATPTITISDLPSGAWEWNVRALGAKRRVLGESETRRFEVRLRPPLTAPELLAPGPEEVVAQAQVSFGWSAVDGAARYHLTANRADTGAEVLDLEIDTPTATSGSLEEGSYAWKVRARDETGMVGDWSVARTFQVALPRVAPVPEPAPSRSQIFTALSAGGTMNLGADLTWEAGLGLGYRPLGLGGRSFLELGVRYGHRQSILSATSGSVSGSASLHRLPIAARFGLSLGRARFRPQVSLALVTEGYWASAKVGETVIASESGLLVGGRLTFGLEGRLGPGHLLLEVDLNQMSTQRGAFEVGGTHAALHLGYRWRIR